MVSKPSFFCVELLGTVTKRGATRWQWSRNAAGREKTVRVTERSLEKRDNNAHEFSRPVKSQNRVMVVALRARRDLFRCERRRPWAWGNGQRSSSLRYG